MDNIQYKFSDEISNEIFNDIFNDIFEEIPLEEDENKYPYELEDKLKFIKKYINKYENIFIFPDPTRRYKAAILAWDNAGKYINAKKYIMIPISKPIKQTIGGGFFTEIIPYNWDTSTVAWEECSQSWDNFTTFLK